VRAMNEVLRKVFGANEIADELTQARADRIELGVGG